LLASIILIGFLGNIFFEKTGLPDALWLILFGVLIGPIFSLVNRETLSQNITIFAPLALIIIMFDSGLNSDLIKLVKQSSRAILLTLSAFVLSVFSAAGFSYFILEQLLKEQPRLPLFQSSGSLKLEMKYFPCSASNLC